MRAIDRLQRQGIRRLGTPRSGFRYVAPGGKKPRAADLERIHALRLPPAWTQVFVSPSAQEKLQAIGKDKAGRWQYRYHPDFVRRRSEAKYRRLLRFADALPRIRARVERDVRKRSLSRDRVLAGMVRVLEACAMRPGSEAYARDNRSFGLATIRPHHVEVRGHRVVFDYEGKSGQRQVRELRDAATARLVREALKLPGRDVFKFVDEAGEIVDVRRRHINQYLREAAGAPFTAKDFRTWTGTLLCASELALREREIVPGRTSRKKLAQAAVKAVAARLGNTPAVARGSYISPAVLDAFADGRCVAKGLGPDDVVGLGTRGALHEAERALVAFLLLAAAKAAAPKPRLLRGGGRTAASKERGQAGAVAKPLRRAARRIEANGAKR